MDWTAVLTPSLGATGLLAVVVILVLTGRLVPKSTVDELRTDKDKQIEIWKTAYETSMSAQEVQREHISTLLDAAQTTTHVIQALPLAAHPNSERSGGRELAQAEE